jgi:hypothetical protein
VTRGRFCRLKLLLALASAVVVGSESRETRDDVTVSDSRLPFSSSPTTRRATVEVFGPASTRDLNSEISSKLAPLITLQGPRRKQLFYPGGVFTAPLPSNGRSVDHSKHRFQQFLSCLRVASLPWEPVCLRSLPSNGSTRYKMLQAGIRIPTISRTERDRLCEHEASERRRLDTQRLYI